MSVQNYKNHVRFYVPHHFIFYPIILLLFCCAIYFSFHDTSNQKLWLFLSVLVFVVGWLAFMLRQHYALILQNRIVRLELCYRYFVIKGERLEKFEDQLSDSQVYALRFASDHELSDLVQKTLQKKLSSDEIKKAIINWLPDHRRV